MQIAEFTDRVRGCERRLYRVARTMLRNDADCEDAVQEALMKAWTKIFTLRHAEYFETWLIRILINECRAIYRRQKFAEVELSENIVQPEKSENSLMDALMELPEKQRIAIELHCVEGYGVREVARALGIHWIAFSDGSGTEIRIYASLFKAESYEEGLIGDFMVEEGEEYEVIEDAHFDRGLAITRTDGARVIRLQRDIDGGIIESYYIYLKGEIDTESLIDMLFE